MRMFLIGMCDIFLILYLTGLTNVQNTAVLTVDDFYELKAMHETLKEDMDESEKSLEEKLRQEKEEKERLLAEQKKQEELAAERLKKLAEEKAKLEAKLAEEEKNKKDIAKSLKESNADRDRIEKDLREKEEMLKSREQLLASLNEEISAKEEARRKMETSLQEELKTQQETIAENQKLVQQLQTEASNAQQLADQMKQEAAQAYNTAEMAKTVEKKALVLKEEALKDKKVAEKKAAEALAARQAAEAEKNRAFEAMQAATTSKKLAEQKAQELSKTIEQIKQDGETAYTNNIVPQVQNLNVTYSRKSFNERKITERELTLLPIKIKKTVYVIIPSKQLGFTSRSDKAPEDLVIVYQGQNIKNALINKADDLIAIALPGYKGESKVPYALETQIEDLMPTLLALRNNGSVSLADKLRGISDNYFIVNRDFLEADKNQNIRYRVRGFRGTGTRGERIVRGDQLIDLNGQLIGIANKADRVLRINSLEGWEKISL